MRARGGPVSPRASTSAHGRIGTSAHRHIGATKTPAARRGSKGSRAPRDIASTAGFFYGV
ncbi:hypothetical protein T210_0118545 [Burkholderia pseudomallei MSHR6137]|nr:hypothetical protein T210_0118545 [Burkholderia pseudomallei MSHR6137]